MLPFWMTVAASRCVYQATAVGITWTHHFTSTRKKTGDNDDDDETQKKEKGRKRRKENCSAMMLMRLSLLFCCLYCVNVVRDAIWSWINWSPFTIFCARTRQAWTMNGVCNEAVHNRVQRCVLWCTHGRPIIPEIINEWNVSKCESRLPVVDVVGSSIKESNQNFNSFPSNTQRTQCKRMMAATGTTTTTMVVMVVAPFIVKTHESTATAAVTAAAADDEIYLQ